MSYFDFVRLIQTDGKPLFINKNHIQAIEPGDCDCESIIHVCDGSFHVALSYDDVISKL